MNSSRILLGIALLSLVAVPFRASGKCGAADGVRLDPGNAVYRVEGQEVHLVDGRSKTGTAPGSASSTRTSVFGTPVFGDLDGDGNEDAALLLVQETGGSGTFYYAAAALGIAGGCRGTNAVLLGDRIVPKEVAILGESMVVDCTDRPPGAPMTARPAVEKTLRLAVRNGELVAVPLQMTQDVAGPPVGIAGVEWRLVRLVVDGKDLALAADGVPTFTAEVTGRVHGLATLNRYFGQAMFDPEGRLHWVGSFGATMMSGPEPLMAQEQAFLGALGQARLAVLQGRRLILQDTAGRTVLEFEQ